MLDIKDFKVKETQSDWAQRNLLLGNAIEITGHSYFVVRQKSAHVGIERLAQILEDCKGKPKLFYWLLKQEKNEKR